MMTTWKKRLVQTGATAVALTLSITVAAVNKTTDANAVEVNSLRSAGIVSAVYAMESSAFATADVSASDVTVVAASATASAHSEWANRLMANVSDYLSVRESADAESSIVGKMYQGDVAEVVSTTNGWYEITSGDVHGFVSADYCVTGEDAYDLAQEVCKTYATATEGGIRVRSEATTDGSVVTTMAEGDSLEVNKDAESVDGWVAVSSRHGNGYVSADFVIVEQKLGEAITIEAEQAAIKAAQEAEAAKAAKYSSAETVVNSAVAASYDDQTLLAALIQCEAGNECYEGQVAVGAVVVNRLRSGAYGGTLYDVIYARGQFTPARSGSVASVAASGPKGSCMQAAAEALAGVDNTGGASGFAPVSSGKGGVAIGNHVFY